MGLLHLDNLPRAYHQQLHQPAARRYPPGSPLVRLIPRHAFFPVVVDYRVVGESAAKGNGDSEEIVPHWAIGMCVGRCESGADVGEVQQGEARVDDGGEGIDKVVRESAVSAERL